MSSPGFEQDNGPAPEELPPVSDEQTIESDPADQALLDEVLQRTQAAGDSSASSFAANLGPLLQVALRHRGKSFDLEPVAIDLVQAALEDQFRRLSQPPDCWRRMAERIARTLFEDPVAHDRLERFWNSLSARRQ